MRHVVVGAREPILQRQEVRAHILGRTGNEAQDLRQAAQHRHLLRAARRGRCVSLFLLRLQPLQERHHARVGAVHVEAADFRDLHDLAGGHAGNHRIALIAPRRERRQHGLNVLLDEKHGRQNDVARRDVVETFIKQLGILSPFGRGMKRDPKAGHLIRQHLVRASNRAGKVTVQRHNNEAHGSATSD